MVISVAFVNNTIQSKSIRHCVTVCHSTKTARILLNSLLQWRHDLEHAPSRSAEFLISTSLFTMMAAKFEIIKSKQVHRVNHNQAMYWKHYLFMHPAAILANSHHMSFTTAQEHYVCNDFRDISDTKIRPTLLNYIYIYVLCQCVFWWIKLYTLVDLYKKTSIKTLFVVNFKGFLLNITQRMTIASAAAGSHPETGINWFSCIDVTGRRCFPFPPHPFVWPSSLFPLEVLQCCFVGFC